MGATRLDFGRVAVGLGSTLPLALSNREPHTAEVTVGATVGDDADAFRPAPAGDVTIPPSTVAEVRVEFAPSRMGPFTARLPVQVHERAFEPS